MSYKTTVSNIIEMAFSCDNQECSEYGSTWITSAEKELGMCTLLDDEGDICFECREIGINIW